MMSGKLIKKLEIREVWKICIRFALLMNRLHIDIQKTECKIDTKFGKIGKM